ncbi:hypothetical protein ABUE31_22770, partial [Mesorhizobium sp. ZMM04-5]
GIKFADFESASCFTLAKLPDLLGSNEAPIEYVCFSDSHLFAAKPETRTIASWHAFLGFAVAADPTVLDQSSVCSGDAGSHFFDKEAC